MDMNVEQARGSGWIYVGEKMILFSIKRADWREYRYRLE